MNEDELRIRMDKYLLVFDKGVIIDYIIFLNGYD